MGGSTADVRSLSGDHEACAVTMLVGEVSKLPLADTRCNGLTLLSSNGDCYDA